MRRAFGATAAFLTLMGGLSGQTVSGQEKPVLTIYTYDSFVSDWGPGPQVEAAFEQQCDCDVQLVGVEDGVALLSRLRLEGKNSGADLVLGLDTNLTAEAAKTGLFAPHGITPEGLTVPIAWDDPNFLPYDWSYFAFVYRTDLLQTPPSSLKELVENSDVELLIQDPRTSTPGLGLLLWVKQVYGDDAAEAWSQLRPRIVTVSAGWSESYGLFQEGEAPMVLSYTTSPAYHIIAEETDKYQAAAFEEGHYMQIEVAGKVASTDQSELADAFLRFMLSPDFQEIIPTTNWMYPAAMPADQLPEAFATAVNPETALLYTPEEVLASRSDWVNEWLAAMSQ